MVSELVLTMATVTDSQAAMEASRGAEARGPEEPGRCSSPEWGDVEVVKEERAVLLGHLVAAQDSLGCAQAEAAREDGARSEVEAEAWLQLAGAASSSVMEALKSMLERSGGVLPFLQAAIDVAHHGSGLFRDPSAVSKVTSMAAAIRAQMEAKERAAREAERKAPPAEEPESSVEDCICMVVDKKQATVAEQVAELEATTAELKGRSLKLEMSKLERHLKASRVSACSVQSQKREKSSISKNKKENEVYKQEMEVQFHEQLKELEAVQSSQVEQKHVALVTEVATLQSEINQEKDKVKKLVEYFTAKELVELAQIFLAKSSELMSVSQGSNGGENFSSGDDTSTVLGNLVNLARPSTGMHSVQPSKGASFDVLSNGKTTMTQDQVKTQPNGDLSSNQAVDQSESADSKGVNSGRNLEGASTNEESKSQQQVDQFGTQSFKDNNKEADGTVRYNISRAFEELQEPLSKPKGESNEEPENQQLADQAVVAPREGNEKQAEQSKPNETETAELEDIVDSENTNLKNNRISQVETLDRSGKQASVFQQLGKNTKDAPNSTEDAPGDGKAVSKSEYSSRSSEESKVQLQSEDKTQGHETDAPSLETGHPSKGGLPANSYQNNSSQSQAEASNKSVEQPSPGIRNTDNESSRLDDSTDPTKPET